ncbi:MAG: 30S ribosomal protein S16 [Candidatus Moraniibacteriota bacterium]
MLAIRFNRTGKRNHASFRITLQEHTKAPGKRHVEILGSYDPHKKVSVLKKDRILHWIGQGAQPSPTVFNLLVREGVVTGKKITKKIPLPVAAEAAIEAAPAEETKIEEAAIQAETDPAAAAEATLTSTEAEPKA